MYKLVDRKKVRAFRKMRFWKRRLTNLSKPRLCVFKSAKHMQVQLFDDKSGVVIVCASSMEKSLRASGLSGVNLAVKVGEVVAKRIIEKGFKEVVFDRNGFNYHGRIKALADSARSSGLSF